MKKEQVKAAKANPTMPKTEEIKELCVKSGREIAKKQTEFLEIYLFEYCEVNNIKESDLKKTLLIEHCKEDNTLNVRSVENPKDIKIALSYYLSIRCDNLETMYHFEVSGQYLLEKDKYPKSTKFLDGLLK